MLASILFMAPSAFAQQRQGAGLPSSYDVVSIKLESQDPAAVGLRYTATGFEAYAVTLTDLIKEAYGLPDVRLVKGASNIKLKYHVVAKLSDVDANSSRSLSVKELSTERQVLLQRMLADRFALAVHHKAMRHKAIRHNAIRHNAIRHNARRHNERRTAFSAAAELWGCSPWSSWPISCP
jgi:hypothetical protein